MKYVELDRTILAELVEMDPVGGLELVRELVQIFFAEAPARLDLMRVGLAEGDTQKLAHGAHAMRGGASGLGATGMAEACARVERQARAGALTGLDDDVDGIEGALPRLARQVEGYVSQLARRAAVE